ncbi:zinc finger BED domain-containing protein 5-like [Belonocnema kinseyi]|uniref:zinc finger BED domain-containing protein 5-like n=1 Tax=Belonocnema kinseyi TaxID=2817044 RepID=UPI00143D1C34|nr:zinc finger BED domain-containing protein 5-like [Belonocnema kinseyi]
MQKTTFDGLKQIVACVNECLRRLQRHVADIEKRLNLLIDETHRRVVGAEKSHVLETLLETAHPQDASKPIPFFEGKLDNFCMEHNEGMFENAMTISDSSNSKLLRASYYASLTIARNSKPHPITETTVIPIIVNAVREVLGEDAAFQIATILPSNNTTKRRIENKSSDIQFQLKTALNSSLYFSLQFDESVDVSGAAQLLCYVKYIGGAEIEEKILFCFAVHGNTTGECLFEVMMEKTRYFNLDRDKCVAICTDGAAAMTGKKVGFVKRILDIAPNAKWSHCMIHRYALAVKPLPDELTFVMEDCVSIVNHIKTSSLKTRLFEELCTKLGADCVQLLYHTQVTWLSRGNP